MVKTTKFPGDTTVSLIFNHVRNIIISSSVAGVGIWSARQVIENWESAQLLQKADLLLSCLVILTGFILFSFNAVHILYKAKEVNIPKWVIAVLFPIYFFVASEIFQVLWKLNTGL